MHWIKRRPNPRVTVPARQFLKRRQVLFFLVNECLEFIELAFGKMQIAKEIIDETQTVVPDSRQPMAHGILVTFDVPRDGANGCAFSQLPNAIAEGEFRRPDSSTSSSCASRDPMPTFKTQQATRTAMPTGKLETSAVSCQTIAAAVPVATVTSG